MRRYLPAIIVLVVALLTAAGGTMLYRAKRIPPQIVPKELAAVADAGDKIHSRGPADAPVTLEEFGDFQCPPCGGFSEPINEMARDYGANLRIVFREFPLEAHQHALTAAFAAEAAGLQGKFWQMHDLLYKEQVAWSKATDTRMLFDSYAGVLGLDLTRFRKDMAGPAVRERIALDQLRGKDLGVTNTPTIFINGTSVPPASLNVPAVRAAIEQALKAKAPVK